MRDHSSHVCQPAAFHEEADYELAEDDAYYQTRLPTSARRYQTSSPQVIQRGNKRYHVQYVDVNVPKRKSRSAQLPPAREVFTDEIEQVPPAKPKTRKVHPLLTFGVGMIACLALFVLVSSAITWIQTTKDDFTYGRPRTFQIDAVVGHNDSPSNLSHFIALNLHRHIQVIEIPGGDSSKERVYQITTLFGDGQELVPVTLTFGDLTGNGKLDMIIHFENTVIAMLNDNGTFRPAKPGEVKGLV